MKSDLITKHYGNDVIISDDPPFIYKDNPSSLIVGAFERFGERIKTNPDFGELYSKVLENNNKATPLVEINKQRANKSIMKREFINSQKFKLNLFFEKLLGLIFEMRWNFIK